MSFLGINVFEMCYNRYFVIFYYGKKIFILNIIYNINWIMLLVLLGMCLVFLSFLYFFKGISFWGRYRVVDNWVL